MATSQNLRRAVISAALTVCIALVLLLVPDATRVYAAYPMGALRAPGELAFVAGHRGDRAAAPENTLPAIQAALVSPLQFVEFDVQLSSDGVPVVMHDATVDRTTDGTGAVADLPIAQLEALDAGSWFSPTFAGTRVPLLTQVLDLITTAPTKRALVELKYYWTTDQVRRVTSEIYLRGLQDRVVFAGFDLSTVANLRAVDPVIPRVIIRKTIPDDVVQFAEAYGAIAVMTTAKTLKKHPDAVEQMHVAGLSVLLYTLNTEDRWTAARELGVDGIVTDVPSELDGWIAATAPGT